MKVYCVCVIGKRNEPLYIKISDSRPELLEEDPLKFHYIAHSSLDVIEERCAARKTSQDHFLGPLFPTELYKIYAFVSCTKLKFILIADNMDSHESDAQAFLKSLYERFIYETCNPFYKMGELVSTNRFDRVVEEMIEKSSQTPSGGRRRKRLL